MAKFHGTVGYILHEETSPGVFTEVVTERVCVGDILRNNQRWVNSEGQIHDNLKLFNRFSIIGDGFAYSNIPRIRYIVWQGVKWTVDAIDIERPRIILTIGGVYNG